MPILGRVAHQLITAATPSPANPLFIYAPRRTRTFNLVGERNRHTDESPSLCAFARGASALIPPETRPNIPKVAHQMLTNQMGVA